MDRHGVFRIGWLCRGILPAVCCIVCACGGPIVEDVSDQRPNILLIVADDHGQWASGCYGNHEIMTPNLDRLAADGVVITRSTSPAPVCSPARASLLTGRLPSQHGIHDYISETASNGRDWLKDEILLPELLQDSGYRTALIGKWHLSANSLEPYRGFDRWLSYNVAPEGWRNQYRHSGNVFFSDQGTPVSVDGFQTEHLAEEAIRFMVRGDSDQPFFVLFAPTETHSPFEGYPENWIARYRGSTFADVPRGETQPLPPFGEVSIPPEPITGMLAQYYAAVSFQDEQIGVLLDALRNAHVLQNTLVVYTSDHGHMNGHHGLVGKANATLPQNLYEETIRVPMLLAWENGLRVQGQSIDIPFDHCDLFQTVLDAAEVGISRETAMEINSPGASLLGYLDDPEKEWRQFQYTEHGNVRLISDGRFKLVRRYPPVDPEFGDEFYDLVNDPRESSNLIDAAEHQEQIAILSSALETQFERYQDPDRSGIRVMDHPPFNGREPWTRLAAALSSPE